MCLLTFFPEGRVPGQDEITRLTNGTIYNDDGHGYAIVAGDRIIVRRGFDGEALVGMFREERREHPHGPALFHSRLATHGAGSLVGDGQAMKNVHPFPVGGDPRIVVAHNGVLPCTPLPKDRRSDTKIFASEELPMFMGWGLQFDPRTKKGRRWLRKWMGRWNKIVILSAHPDWERPAYLINADEGIWKDGVWYSNSGFEPYYRYGYHSTSTLGSSVLGGTSDWTEDDWAWLASYRRRAVEEFGTPKIITCLFCEARGSVNEVTQICRECLTCQDCANAGDRCQCWIPAAADAGVADPDPAALDAMTSRSFVSGSDGNLYVVD